MAQQALLEPLSPPSGPNLHAVQDRTWRFEIVGVPIPQGSKKGFVHPRIPNRVLIVDDNAKKLKPWREQVTLTAKALRPVWLREPINGPVGVGLVFVRRRPRSHLRTDGRTLSAAATRYPDTKPDVDKLERAILDGLTDVAFVDDARVVSLCSVKRWAEAGEPEKVLVEITAL
jgi:crossover junction endodeoxyribonuclease RusA